MSGGVDSSVAAALLKRAGFSATGVYMKLNNFSSLVEKRARKVAKILKIPFYVFNFEKEFKKKIVNCFLKEYKAGRTPNPCVVCNKEIKFGLLLGKTLRLNADFVATGHYARKRETNDKQQETRYRLLKGKDIDKDQSYFLWQLSQNQLSRILFPVGNHTKEEVRKLAKKFRLPVFDAPESQEICFISGNIADFLKKYLKEKPGNIVVKEDKSSSSPFAAARVDKQGKILGRHRGLWFYTIGQRKGIGLSGGPYFVLDKNIKQNVLIVTKNEKDLLKKELMVKNVNWILGKPPKFPIKIKVKIRYRHEPAWATLYRLNSKVYRLRFDGPQRAITAGQSVVFYSGQELLGGGIICYNK